MTITVSIDTSGLRRRIDALGAAKRGLGPGLDKALRAAGAVAMARWKALAPVDAGQLRQSVRRVRKLGPLHYLVAPEGSAQRYALFVDRGRKAGERMPPVDALMRWGRIRKIAESLRARYRAGLVGSVFHRGRARLAHTSRGVDRFLRSAAFLVARAIKRRGIRPRLMSIRAAEEARIHLRASIRALEGEVARRARGG